MTLPLPADLFDLRGRTAVVTGGAGTLGGVFARVLAPRSRIVVMPPERSRDVNGPLDFAFLEFLVRERIVELPDVTS